MNIAIIDADLICRKKHRFPNLASMKISAYNKTLGNNVILKLDYDNLDQYDYVYISKVFLDTIIPENIIGLHNIKYGGTGFHYDKAELLPDEIEHHMPDYHLYDNWVEEQLSEGYNIKEFDYYKNYSIGFTTRGCVRQCSFCVNVGYTKCVLHSPPEEFIDGDRKYICLLDDNVFSCQDWRLVFNSLRSTNKRFQFKQGLDERLLTDEKCDILFNSKWIGDFIFAFDDIKDKDIVEEKLKMIRLKTNRQIKFYTFCGYNHNSPEKYDNDFWLKDIIDLFERIVILMKYQSVPYIMRYKDYELSPFRGIYITLARWCNQPNFFKKNSFRQYCLDVKANGVNTSAGKYLTSFEYDYPEIAKKYFDIRYEDFKLLPRKEE